MLHQPLKNEISGFDIYGVILPDGKIRTLNGHVYDSFPREVQLVNLVYGLESVKLNDQKRTIISPDEDLAKYYDPHQSRNNICWGMYC